MKLQNPNGFTLLEVVVALALFGLILGMSALALASLRKPASAIAWGRVMAVRDSSIRTGQVVVLRVAPGVMVSGLFLPDGRFVGAGLDRLTGARHAAR